MVPEREVIGEASRQVGAGGASVLIYLDRARCQQDKYWILDPPNQPIKRQHREDDLLHQEDRDYWNRIDHRSLQLCLTHGT